jgi:hypothetical protein
VQSSESSQGTGIEKHPVSESQSSVVQPSPSLQSTALNMQLADPQESRVHIVPSSQAGITVRLVMMVLSQPLLP